MPRLSDAEPPTTAEEYWCLGNGRVSEMDAGGKGGHALTAHCGREGAEAAIKNNILIK